MDDDGLTAGAVARRLGVAVTTLRTWHQRYGLGPNGHQPGRHRRYTTDDVARLEQMQRLTADGVPPAEAARWVRGGGAPGVRTHDGGGLALSGASPVARGLARAAMRLDGDAIRRIGTEAIAGLGVVGAWEAVLAPVLAAIGERHGRTGALIEVEHLLSACCSDVLGAVPRPGGRAARALLACADEEQHSLPIEALAAALGAAGVGSRMLGARVPVEALRTAVRRTGPAAVLVWSHDAATASTAQLTALTGDRTRPLLLAAAGPGWAGRDLPAGVVVPHTLAEAVDLIRAAVA